MLLSKPHIFIKRCLVAGLSMACLSCMAAQRLDRDGSEKPASKMGKKWKMTGIGEMKAHCGAKLGFISYQNQDGSVTIIRGAFDSDKQAASQLNSDIQNAKEIIEHSFRTDKSGKTVGERVVAVLIQKDPAANLQAVLWTEGPKYSEVVGDSLPVVFEWEKKLLQPRDEKSVAETVSTPLSQTSDMCIRSWPYRNLKALLQAGADVNVRNIRGKL